MVSKYRQRFQNIKNQTENRIQMIIDKNRDFYHKKYKMPIFKSRNKVYKLSLIHI